MTIDSRLDLRFAGLGSARAAPFFADCDRLIDFDKLADALGSFRRNDSGPSGAPDWPVTPMVKVLFVPALQRLLRSLASHGRRP